MSDNAGLVLNTWPQGCCKWGRFCVLSGTWSLWFLAGKCGLKIQMMVWYFGGCHGQGVSLSVLGHQLGCLA